MYNKCIKLLTVLCNTKCATKLDFLFTSQNDVILVWATYLLRQPAKLGRKRECKGGEHRKVAKTALTEASS